MTHGGNVWQGSAPDEWLDFSANLRPEGTPKWVRDALTEAVDAARYYPDPRMQRGKAALAEYLNIGSDCVLPTAGGISAIRLANCVHSRQTVIFTPCFCEYAQFASSEVRKVSLLGTDHAILEPAEALRGGIERNSLVWLCNPMNPVGTAFSREQILRLLDMAEAFDSWLAVDEAFIDYCGEYSSAKLVGSRRLIIVGSMTKILGIPGVRLGYLCAAPELIQTLEKQMIPWELSCFAEAVLAELPRHRKDISGYARRNSTRREVLREALEGLGTYVYLSEATFLLADFGRNVQPVISELRKKHILVRDCADFDGINDGCHLRLAVKGETENELLIRAIGEAISCAENR